VRLDNFLGHLLRQQQAIDFLNHPAGGGVAARHGAFALMGLETMAAHHLSIFR
jgi:hypothetical protein